MRWGFDTDWGISSLLFCKLRLCLFTISNLTSMTCLCLAIIDQYLATSSRVRFRQWCNIKLAHRLTSIFVIIWILHGIPYVIFENHIISSLTNATICQVTNPIFSQYLIYGYNFTLVNLLPWITYVFGLMAYYNARHLIHRTVPLVRLQLDKQLTGMVLVQILISFFTLVPFSIDYIFTILNGFESDPIVQTKQNLVGIIMSNLLIVGDAVRHSINNILFSQIQTSFCFLFFLLLF
jgi:hypothetical protein